jgi:hypothetical protein
MLNPPQWSCRLVRPQNVRDVHVRGQQNVPRGWMADTPSDMHTPRSGALSTELLQLFLSCVNYEKSFWYVRVLNRGEKAFQPYHALHRRYTSFHLNRRSSANEVSVKRGTHFPSGCFNSNLRNIWTALANDIPRVLEGMAQTWSVDDLDVHDAEKHRLGEYRHKGSLIIPV